MDKNQESKETNSATSYIKDSCNTCKYATIGVPLGRCTHKKSIGLISDTHWFGNRPTNCPLVQQNKEETHTSMHTDINNPLEDIKIEAALNSEHRKLEYRRINKPKDINILDHTIIAALKHCIPVKIRIEHMDNYKSDPYHPHCGRCDKAINGYLNKPNYCPDCGAPLIWEDA